MKPQRFKISSDFIPADASAAIIQCEGKYLLQKRDANPDVIYGGYWGLFGGAIELGETPFQAVIREVLEEINITIDPNLITKLTYVPMGQKIHRAISRFYFFSMIDAKEAKNIRLTEGEKYSFFDLDDLEDLRIAPYDQFIIDLYANSINA